MYSIKREGPRWYVMHGNWILASFDNKQEANDYIVWLKEENGGVA
jgi:hypothetical protein